MAKCKYKSRNRLYECQEEALPDSKEGFCLFHERRKDKDIDKFNAGIKAKLEKKDYDFTGYYSPDEADFINQKFEDEASFVGAEFQRTASFEGAEFWDNASFDGAQFEEDAIFQSCKFQRRARFERAKFSLEAFFRGAVFKGSASFEGAEFGGRGWFVGAKFENQISFARVTFQKKEAIFRGAEFRKKALFGEVHFNDQARFGEAVFYEAARFENAKFVGEAFFTSTKKSTEFHGSAFFKNAEFAKIAWFDEVKFFGNVQFAKTIFQDLAYFRSTEFGKNKVLVFYGAQFKMPAFFEWAQFGGMTIFQTAAFDKTVSFHQARFAHDSDAKMAYRKAKIAYQREGNYAEAGDYYLLEMRARRKAKWRLESAALIKSLNFLKNKTQQILPKTFQAISTLSQRFPGLKRSIFSRKMEIFREKIIKPNPAFWEKLEKRLVLLSRGLERFFMDWTCAYGEKPLWVIRTAAILILGLAILYWLSGGIILRPGADIAIRRAGFLDSVYFSVVTFTTLGYGDWHPHPNHWIRYVAMAEAFTGAFMMALFILCFARKWMR